MPVNPAAFPVIRSFKVIESGPQQNGLPTRKRQKAMSDSPANAVATSGSIALFHIGGDTTEGEGRS